MGATSSKKKKNRNFTERLFMFFFLLKFQPEHCYVILSAYLDSIVHLFRIRGALSLHWVKIHCCPLLARQHLIASLGRVAVTAHCCRSIDEPFDPKVMLSRSWSRRWLWRQTLALELNVTVRRSWSRREAHGEPLELEFMMRWSWNRHWCTRRGTIEVAVDTDSKPINPKAMAR